MAQELLNREQASPGSFTPSSVAKAREALTAGAGGRITVPEQTIAPDEPGRSTLPEQTIEGQRMPGGELAIRGLTAGLSGAANAMTFGLAPKIVKGVLGDEGINSLDADRALFERAPSALPKDTGLVDQVKDALRRLATPQGLGELAGYAAPQNIANRIGGAALGAMRQAPGILARVGVAAGEAGLSSAIGAGGRSAVEGGSVDDVGRAAGEAGLIGGLTGGALGGALRGGLRGAIPEIAQAESGGAKTSLLRGIVPGSEQKAAREAAAARGVSAPDMLATDLVRPIMDQGSFELKGARAMVARDLASYAQSPEGKAPTAMGELLDRYTGIHRANMQSRSLDPLAEADLGGLRQSINRLADIKVAPKSQAEGGQIMSLDEARMRGLDVSGPAEKARAAQLRDASRTKFPAGYDPMMDIGGDYAMSPATPSKAEDLVAIVKPRAYTGAELAQDIQNVGDKLEKNRDSSILKQIQQAMFKQRDKLPELSSITGIHKDILSKGAYEMGMASAPEGTAYTRPNEEKGLFNSIRGYGDAGRYGAIDDSLRAIAGRTPSAPGAPKVTRQLQLLQSLKALERLRAEQLPPASIRASGQPGVSLTKRGIGLRADRLLELLMGTPVPLWRAAGEETGR